MIIFFFGTRNFRLFQGGSRFFGKAALFSDLAPFKKSNVSSHKK